MDEREAIGAGSKAVLAAALAGARDAIIVTDAADEDGNTRIVYVNDAFIEMTGYTADELVGASPRVLQGPDTSADARAKIRAALVQLEPVTVEICNYGKDGRAHLVELSVAPIFDDDGACRHWVRIARDMTERQRQQDERIRELIAEQTRLASNAELLEHQRMSAQLAYAAAHDDLTGLYSRPHFMTCVEVAVARYAADCAQHCSVLLIDLDRFKFVNDHVGQRAGDLILRDLARRIESFARPGDTLARLDGDEFGLLLDGLGANDAERLAQAILHEIHERSLSSHDVLPLSASIGIVELTPEVSDPEAVMHDAEIAVERALRLGGGRCQMMTPELRAEVAAVERVRSDLPGAVERGEMRLYYQPLVDIGLGRIYGFEGLVRWQHPVRGLISPDQFIPAAEEDGLIVDIGRWVLVEGCRKAREFQALAGEPLLMSLNVSSQQLIDPRFLSHLQAVLAASELDPHTLQLEITESTFLSGGSQVGALFARIRSLGMKIAFDDFGTGYSSLSYLERYQFDSLKIDRSFVGRMHDASAKSEILRMIVALAHALGVDVIAEGVETLRQCDALGDLGCSHLQGYLFSRPLNETQVIELICPLGLQSADALGSLLSDAILSSRRVRLTDAEREELRDQVDAALETHRAWMDLLHGVMAGGDLLLDPAALACEDVCPIGVWLSHTISPTLRTMPLYHVTKSRHAVFHRSMARLITAAIEGVPDAADSLRPDGDFSVIASSLQHTLCTWRNFAMSGDMRVATA